MDDSEQFEMVGGWELPDGYDDPREMSDETLTSEMSALGAHRSAETLTEEQDNYYQALSIELFNRMSGQ